MTRTHRLDPARSSVTVHTRTSGLFARLAHDLQLRSDAITGEAMQEENATATVHLTSVRVAGVLKRDGSVDPNTLSASDMQTILNKVRETLLAGTGVTATGTLTAPSRVSLTVKTQRGEQTVSTSVRTTPSDDGAVTCVGACEISLKALGCPPIEGPLGAFKLKDVIEVSFNLVFVKD